MYKDLKLNRDKIEEVIELYAQANYQDYDISKDVKGELFTRYNLVFNNVRLFLDVYYNNKGGTTIQINNGKHQDEKVKIAEYIASHPFCQIAIKDENNRSMLFRGIDRKVFESIIDIVSEDAEQLSLDENDVNIIIKFRGVWSDKITLTYGKNTKNVRIQGRPLRLFNEAVSYFNEVIDLDKVIDTLEENYDENVSRSTVETQYRMYLPNSHDKHPEKLKKSLLRAVYNLNIMSQEYQCTELTFEVLRALEGHIKYILFDLGVESPSKFGSLSMFHFDTQSDTVCLKEPQRALIGNARKIGYLEKAYKFLVLYRHKIFHWDYPDCSGIDQTVQIEDLDEAKRIIRETLLLIDEYH